MNNIKNPARQWSRYIFYFLMIAILGWFVFMQLFGADERAFDNSSSSVFYSGTFTWKKSYGTTQKISVPGTYNVPAGETMVITTILPKDFDASTIAIRSSLQDVNFYVDGSLRVQYTTRDTRLVGKNSASRYIFCPTSQNDAGKELRIELTTYTSNYSGIVNQVFCGDKADIWQEIYSHYGSATYIAIFILLAGLISILFSLTFEIVYHTHFDMEYLSWCMVMGAIWMLGESKFRQVLVPNASALGSLCFVMILLGPIPLLLYADNVQNGLHRQLYRWIIGITLLNFMISSVLTVTNVADYIETLPVGQLILIGTFFMIFIHLCMYTRTNKNRSDHILLLGLLISMVCVSAESISVYFVTSLSGLFLGIGMLILLFTNLLRTIRNIIDIETSRQQQEMEKKQKQTEEMSLQMMETLSTTIEAKNEYTCGHSHRVAEYAALIAAELGWSSENIQNLKYAAYLHDIGKIGIPEMLLNKPSQLTDEECDLIRNHTIIGAEILKDVAFAPYIAEVSRSHHERYDGCGYPDGLKGTDIPIHARIITVADSYDAMNSRRIYRNALPPEMIRNEFEKNRGRQFDPQITDIFLKLLDEDHIVLKNTHTQKTTVSSESDNTINKFISEVVNTIKSQEDLKDYDFLTGLPMRNLGERLIAEFMQEHDGCLIFLDMDNLKKINDIHGHTAGDRALKNLGTLLSHYMANGIASRLGGDEFLLFLPDITVETVSEIMRQLFHHFQSIVEADPEIKDAALSAGLCVTSTNETFADCYSKADKALYDVKQNGKNHFSFYHQIDSFSSDSSSTAKDLKQVAASLHKSGNYAGALSLNYRDFCRQFEYMHQLVIHSSNRCYLVMVTLENTASYPPQVEEIEQTLSYMEQAIRSTTRCVDVCTRYSSMQYLIMLFQLTEIQIPHVMERIFTQYYALSKREDFLATYEYQDIADDNVDVIF